MNPSTTILLKEWKRLSEQESTAIAAGEWTELNDLLDQKDRIKNLLEDYQGEDYSTADRQLISELIAITEENQQRLNSAMEAVRGQIQTEDRSLSTISKVNQIYGTRGDSSYWHSYS
mgnify:CR=1 FL=1